MTNDISMKKSKLGSHNRNMNKKELLHRENADNSKLIKNLSRYTIKLGMYNMQKQESFNPQYYHQQRSRSNARKRLILYKMRNLCQGNFLS